MLSTTRRLSRYAHRALHQQKQLASERPRPQSGIALSVHRYTCGHSPICALRLKMQQGLLAGLAGL